MSLKHVAVFARVTAPPQKLWLYYFPDALQACGKPQEFPQAWRNLTNVYVFFMVFHAAANLSLCPVIESFTLPVSCLPAAARSQWIKFRQDDRIAHAAFNILSRRNGFVWPRKLARSADNEFFTFSPHKFSWGFALSRKSWGSWWEDFFPAQGRRVRGNKQARRLGKLWWVPRKLEAQCLIQNAQTHTAAAQRSQTHALIAFS